MNLILKKKRYISMITMCSHMYSWHSGSDEQSSNPVLSWNLLNNVKEERGKYEISLGNEETLFHRNKVIPSGPI